MNININSTRLLHAVSADSGRKEASFFCWEDPHWRVEILIVLMPFRLFFGSRRGDECCPKNTYMHPLTTIYVPGTQ